MLFFGLFTLVVLPIFLVYCAGIIKRNPEFGPTGLALIIRIVLYIFAGMAVLADLVLLGRLFRLF